MFHEFVNAMLPGAEGLAGRELGALRGLPLLLKLPIALSVDQNSIFVEQLFSAEQLLHCELTRLRLSFWPRSAPLVDRHLLG